MIVGMCRMCEGFSLEDVLALESAAIDEYGFIVMAVEDPEEPSSGMRWCYTIGLLDRADHPELIVAGPSVEVGGALLNRLGKRVLAGARFQVGDRVKVRRGRARVGAVHPVQYEIDTFNVWHNLQAVRALHAPELEAVQIFAPSSWFCGPHQHVQPDLSDPQARLDHGAV
jgi:Domain of unknown function (DUF4262)